PIEQEGTYPLPEAQIDRFLFKLKVDYPTREEERLIAENNAHPEFFPQAMTVASLEDITAARKMVDKIYMDPKLLEYVLDIVFATRPKHHTELSERQQSARLSELVPLIQYGASPRATISLVLAAKALAFMEGRAYVIPQDVKDVAHDVLRHRIMLSYEAEAENMSADDLITKILEELKTP
ncbi:MAG: MoxR family ATPase, partial [Lentisphaerae bacterium]|nr:MoxR family ATPase [Lentisphaerota bacterium]